MADSAFAEISPSDDRGAERWRIPATQRASRSERSLNSGDSKICRHAWLFRRGLEFNPPARESMAVHETGGVHFIEIEDPDIAAFEFLRSPNGKSKESSLLNCMTSARSFASESWGSC
jgi:hypothetical protein